MEQKMALRSANANGLIAAMDAALTPGYFVFYTEPMAANVAEAISTQVTLATTVCSDPCATELNGVVTFSPIADDLLADNTGECTWARGYDGDGNAVADFTVGLLGSGADLIANDVNFIQDGPVKFNSLVITFY